MACEKMRRNSEMVPAFPNLFTKNDNNSDRCPFATPWTFREALVKSYTVSEDFLSFHVDLLSFLEKQYCHCCLIDPMNFVFGVWCLGVFMVSIGVVYFIACPDSLVVHFYLLIDGVLSVFFYPLLLAYLPKRVGHSENNNLKEDQEEADDPRWWLAVLLIRSLTLFIWSSVLPIYHSCCHQPQRSKNLQPIFPNFCATSYPIAMVSVLFSWAYVLFIVIPLLFCLLLFRLAPLMVVNRSSTTALPL